MENIQRLLASSTPIDWLFAGDSITQGALHTYGARDYTQLFAEHVRFTLGRSRDLVSNTAISGRTSRDVLEDFDRSIGRLSPDVVFVMLGMNDCASTRDVSLDEFRDNLRAITHKSRDLGDCQVVLQTSCPIIAESAPERASQLPTYMNVVREVAREEKVVLIDHTPYWEGRIAQTPVLRYAWMNDPIHPNAEGHRAFAHFIFQELGLLPLL